MFLGYYILALKLISFVLNVSRLNAVLCNSINIQ